QQTQLFKLFHYSGASFETIQTGEADAGCFSHLGLWVNDNDLLQIVTHSHLVVVWIVCRGHFYCACTEVRIHKLIGDDWNVTTRERKRHSCADQIAKALILRVDGDSSVSEHCFRPGCSDSYALSTVFCRVTQIV